MNSIFQAGGALPADHPTYVERQADRDALRAALNGDYLHVIAPRQFGKTSLLKRLAHHLGEMGCRCAYMDLSTLMDLPKPTWYAELGKELANNLTPGQVPALANQVDLRRYLLSEALPWPDSQPYIALFLDEVEGVGKARDTDGLPFSDTFFMTLRNLYIQRSDYEGALVVALAGAVNPSDLVKDPAISPFNVGQEIGLEDFTLAETQTLTEKLVDLDLSVDEIAHQVIYDWTNGHPYLTQRICSELEKVAGDLTAIAPEHVDHVVAQVILNPTNPLQRDKNLRHVAKMLTELSRPAAHVWARLRSGESIPLTETSDDVFLDLYLTGAVKIQAGHLTIRNRIYEQAFMKRPVTHSLPAVYPERENRTMDKSLRVFISSTWEDLKPEREAVEKALHRMQNTAFAGMEYFGSRSETPKELSLAEVERSDIYIGIFAHRYGSGITEAEYRRARQRDIPCLIYCKDDSVPVVPAHMERDAEKAAKLTALKQELQRRHTVSFFHSPDHLATQVIADLHNLLGSSPTVRTEEPAPPAPKYQINIQESHGAVIGDGAQVTQVFGGSGSVSSHPPNRPLPQTSGLRLQHLADNIRQDLDLLKDYEDALRYEDDPRRRARHRREIEQLRESATRYQQEYTELRRQASGEPSPAMQEIATQLQQMNAKLDALLAGQDVIRNDLGDLRQVMLARFDANEQAILTAVVAQLDRSQLATVQAVLDAVEVEHLPMNEVQETLAVVQQVLAEIRQQGISLGAPVIDGEVEQLAEAVAAPHLDVKHKLKLTAPIIPLILSYEGEVELGSGLNLEGVWQRLLAKVRSESSM